MKDRKPYGFYSKMDNKQLENYVKENYNGKSLMEFREDGQAYHEVLKRGLMGNYVKKRILVREKQPNGFFKYMTNDQLEEYVSKNHYGKSLIEFKEDGGAYDEVLKRKLVDELVEKRILVRKHKKSREISFINLSDKQLENYVKENHYGENLAKFSKDSAYVEVLKRKLIDDYVERGILIRKQKKRSNISFINLNNKQLKAYVKENHYGESLTELQKDAGACREVYKRRLINYFVKKGVLIRKYRSKGFFKYMTNEQLEDYVREHHSGKSLGEFSEDSQAYNEVHKRRLINYFVKKGVLIRKYKKPVKDEKQQLENLLDGYIKQ